jgi:hypothetical protein
VNARLARARFLAFFCDLTKFVENAACSFLACRRASERMAASTTDSVATAAFRAATLVFLRANQSSGNWWVVQIPE